MKLELISFELATKLKEIDFKVECDFVYAISVVKAYPVGEAILIKNLYLPNVKEQISAPTLALAQKWFRDAHNLEVLAPSNAGGYFWEICKSYHKDLSGGTSVSWSNDSGPNGSGTWETHEGAVENALLEAVEIVKLRKALTLNL